MQEEGATGVAAAARSLPHTSAMAAEVVVVGALGLLCFASARFASTCDLSTNLSEQSEQHLSVPTLQPNEPLKEMMMKKMTRK